MAYNYDDGVNRYRTEDGSVFTNEADAREYQN